MVLPLGKWVFALDGAELPAKETAGAKARSIARIRSLGLDVPPAFVVSTHACRVFLPARRFPDGLERELVQGIAWLEEQTGRRFGRGPRPLLVSVRSGAPVSMPGMMDTVLNLGINDATEKALAEECGNAAFARDTHRRFIDLYLSTVLKAAGVPLDGDDPSEWRATAHRVASAPIPEDVFGQLQGSVRAVFESWNSRRARRYRSHHGIDDRLGTAVTVQAMVFGNMDEHSGTGVVFSRNPLTGDPVPFGQYLTRAQGEDVVSGKRTPLPLAAMGEWLPEAMSALLRAAALLERENREVQDIEFTVERGRLFLLQTRAAKLAPLAAARIAVDLVREGLIEESEALRRVTPEQARILLSPRLDEGAAEEAELLAKGEGACPGVGIGTVVTSSEEAERRAAVGQRIVLARPTTSPDDLHGMIASRAIITEHGGSASHAAVVSRALGLPCVVGCGDGCLAHLAGQVVTVDAQSGRIFSGALNVVSPEESDNEWLATLTQWAAVRAPIRIVPSREAPDGGVADLDQWNQAGDPAQLAKIIGSLKGIRGARGGAIASDEGVRAAIRAGLEFIVAEHILPPLLAAVQASQCVPEGKDRGQSER